MAGISIQTCVSSLTLLATAPQASASSIRETLTDCSAEPAQDLIPVIDLSDVRPQDGPVVAGAAASYLAAFQDVPAERHYERRGEIGRGFYGTVFLAREKGSRQDVALKVYRPPFHSKIEGDPPLRGFFNELRFLTTIDDRAVVRVLRCGLTAGLEPYLVLRYMSGGTLTAKIRKLASLRSRSAKAGIALAEQTLRAANVVHESRVVHGDIDASNLLFDRGGRLKMVDFAMARRLGEKPYAFEYASRNDKEPEGIAHDVFQLGKILYRIFTRQSGEISDLTAQREPPPSKKRPDLEIPAWVDELVLRALHHDKTQRWPDATAMRNFFLSNHPHL